MLEEMKEGPKKGEAGDQMWAAAQAQVAWLGWPVRMGCGRRARAIPSMSGSASVARHLRLFVSASISDSWTMARVVALRLEQRDCKVL